MKYFRRLSLIAAAVCVLTLHAELGEWVEHLAVESGLQRVFFGTASLPAGPVEARRPPAETRPALTALIAATPTNAQLYRLRASEAELALDFTAAEADWRRYAQLHANRADGYLALADFYHRRLRPADEVQALDTVASPAAFARSLSVIREQALPATLATAQYRAWIAHDPHEAAVYQQFFNYLVEQKQFTAASRRIDVYRQSFPADDVEPVREAASLAERQGTPAQALAVYDRAFAPLMPDALVKDYFDLLTRQGKLRDFLAAARGKVQADPQDLIAAARIFHYYRQQSNVPAARRALLEFANRKKSWTAGEHFTIARLLESIQEYDEAARHYYALYTLPGAEASYRELALGGLARLLLAAPEQPIRFGAGNLSYYRDIGAMDPYPGFLNGILSLLLNSAQPHNEYQSQDQAATAYFHRSRASDLIGVFDRQFPKSPQRADLHTRLIEAYAAYGDDSAVIRAGLNFRAGFPNAPERTRIALLMADAYARLNQSQQEFALYDRVLKELAAQAGGVPLGPQSRAPEYAAVLDRYISRLAGLHRIGDALQVYRSELDRNPKEPGLYERLAAFLEQNHMAADVEQIYQGAMQQFPGASWEDKLARWYLRQRRTAQFTELTGQIVKIFSGTELERYFREVVAPASLDARLYLQLNLYAHERFPNDLVFVKNLLAAYAGRGTADGAAYTRLLRAYWFYDDGLRAQFFEALSHAGKLDVELATIRAAHPDANPSAAEFLAEGEAWQSHFEAAAPWLRATSVNIPGDISRARRASAVYRSLAAFDPDDTDVAVALAVNMQRADPRNRELLAGVGDVYADRGLLARAAPYWNRMPQTAPGSPEAYLDAATVFWDYYRFGDALRLIGEARAKLGDPALYAYQEGAIYEGEHNYPDAVREYIKGALTTPDSASTQRLMSLANRPSVRALVDRTTLRAASSSNPGIAALRLRAAVLDAQKRAAELESFLTGVARQDGSPETLSWIESAAAAHEFDPLHELALERQIQITRDPVDKIRLRLALVQFYEGKHQTGAARRAMDALYADNPAILGVVRAAVDFYWRNRMPGQAIDTLTRAAAAANADYRRQFTLEAVRKSTESTEYANARSLLAPLLQSEPYNAEYLAAMAQTWAQAGDDRGLSDFYSATIQALQKAPLSSEERATSIAAMRRGIIPALTRLQQYAAAADQYIEIINRYPEDEGLVREAASYAIGHGLQQQLAAYYTKTAAAAPRDYRWPLVEARLATYVENFSAAIANYSAAIAIRPDRMDFFAARATLEERLMRFEEAAATYERLYELSYRDPRWLIKAAETYARLQKPDLAVETLRKALLAGRPERPDIFFEIARTLDSWGLVRQAVPFAERGQAASPDAAALYVSLTIRTRAYETAFSRIASIEGPLVATGQAARRYFTPEEMSAFAAFLEKRGIDMLPVAEQAGLGDLEARWHFALLARPNALSSQPHEQLLINLETSRMQFAELARYLEAYWKMRPGMERYQVLDEAAAAWRADGDSRNELRVLESDPQVVARYLELLAQLDPARLVTLAGAGLDTAVDQAIAKGSPALAYQAIAAIGRKRPPVWTHAYTALAGLYEIDRGPRVDAAFRGALDIATIGRRLAEPANRDGQLAGDVWFYYGSRYGEYLADTHQGRPDDYLPASLEAAPGNPAAYAALADFYADRSDAARALADYDRALELSPGLGYVHDHAALVLWKEGRHAEAIARWKSALAALLRQQGRPNLADEFWVNAPAAIEHIAERHLIAELRPELLSLLRAYVQRHEGYRFDPLLEPLARHGGLDLILDTASASAQPAEFLGRLSGARWIGPRDRQTILLRLIATRPASEVRRYQVELAALFVEFRQTAAAEAVLASIPRETRIEMAGQIAPLEIQVAAQSGGLAQLLEGYRRSPETEPGVGSLRDAAQALQKAGDEASARRVLEFLYTREIERGNFDAANFLGLAELRLQAGATPSAVALLHRMALISGEPFENFVPAADLLEQFGRTQEAIEFLAARTRAVPWDEDARLKLGEAQRSTPIVTALVADPLTSYAWRAAGARLLAKWHAHAPAGITGELALLARGKIDPAAAEQPLYFEARVTAAGTTADPLVRARLLRGALAIQPDAVETRLAVFGAEFQARQYQLAVSALKPMGPGSIPMPMLPDLATAYENLGELESARQTLHAASPRADLQKRIEALDRRIEIAAQDALRRPEVTDNVAQEHMVRPRLQP